MLSAAKHLFAHRERPFAEFTLSEAHGLRATTHSRSWLVNFIIAPTLSYCHDLDWHIWLGISSLDQPFLPACSSHAELARLLCTTLSHHYNQPALLPPAYS